MFPMVSTADRKERKTLYQERSSTLLQGLLFLLFYNMEDREDELSVGLLFSLVIIFDSKEQKTLTQPALTMKKAFCQG